MLKIIFLLFFFRLLSQYLLGYSLELNEDNYFIRINQEIFKIYNNHFR